MAMQLHPAHSSFAIYHEAAKDVFGAGPKLELLHEMKGFPFAHEAGIYVPEDEVLFVTSNRFTDPKTKQQSVQITRLVLPRDGSPLKVEPIETANVPLANGGIRYTAHDYDGVLFCAQGDQQTNGGISFMEIKPPYKSQMLVDSFFDRPFNSPNDVVTWSDNSIWFTDPIYGFEQGIRPEPRLPNQVYRFDPEDNSTRAVADGFGRPNGLAFSPDKSILYVTDTEWIHGDGTTDDTRASHIYAFDVANHGGKPFLQNRRLFAMADNKIPDGIKCDVHGNVYSGCGDGINVWSPGGVLIGKILIEGGAANFCFGRDGQMFILSEEKLWQAQLNTTTKGALLEI